LRRLFKVGRQWPTNVGFCERKRQVVETGSEVLDNVPDHRCELERRVSDWLGANGHVAGLGIYLFADAVGLRSDPPLDLSLKSLQVLLCPPELDAVAHHWHALTSS
jgi:hypothetical protein